MNSRELYNPLHLQTNAFSTLWHRNLKVWAAAHSTMGRFSQEGRTQLELPFYPVWVLSGWFSFMLYPFFLPPLPADKSKKQKTTHFIPQSHWLQLPLSKIFCYRRTSRYNLLTWITLNSSNIVRFSDFVHFLPDLQFWPYEWWHFMINQKQRSGMIRRYKIPLFSLIKISVLIFSFMAKPHKRERKLTTLFVIGMWYNMVNMQTSLAT